MIISVDCRHADRVGLSLHQYIYCRCFWITKIDQQWGAKEMTTIKCDVRIPIKDFLLTSWSFYSWTSSVISPHFFQTSSSSFTQPHQVNHGQGAKEKKRKPGQSKYVWFGAMDGHRKTKPALQREFVAKRLSFGRWVNSPYVFKMMGSLLGVFCWMIFER